MTYQFNPASTTISALAIAVSVANGILHPTILSRSSQSLHAFYNNPTAAIALPMYCINSFSTGRLIVFLVAVHWTRVIERHFGSNAYAAYISVTTAITCLVQTVLFAFAIRTLPSGALSGSVLPVGSLAAAVSPLHLPVAIAGSLVARYLIDIPSLPSLTFFTFRVSPKLPLILMLAHVASWDGVPSLMSAGLGLLIGTLVTSLAPLRRLRIPQAIAGMAARTLAPIFPGLVKPVIHVSGHRDRRAPTAGARQAAGQPPAPRPAAPPQPAPAAVQRAGPRFGPDVVAQQRRQSGDDGRVDPEAIAQLIGMGFAEEQARYALQVCAQFPSPLPSAIYPPRILHYAPCFHQSFLKALCFPLCHRRRPTAMWPMLPSFFLEISLRASAHAVLSVHRNYICPFLH